MGEEHEGLGEMNVAKRGTMDWRTAYGHLTALERQGLVEHHRENGVHTWAVQIKGRVPIKEL